MVYILCIQAVLNITDKFASGLNNGLSYDYIKFFNLFWNKDVWIV